MGFACRCLKSYAFCDVQLFIKRIFDFCGPKHMRRLRAFGLGSISRTRCAPLWAGAPQEEILRPLGNTFGAGSDDRLVVSGRPGCAMRSTGLSKTLGGRLSHHQN